MTMILVVTLVYSLQGGMVSEKVDDMDHTIHNDNGSVPLVDDVDPEEVEQPAGSA